MGISLVEVEVDTVVLVAELMLDEVEVDVEVDMNLVVDVELLADVEVVVLSVLTVVLGVYISTSTQKPGMIKSSFVASDTNIPVEAVAQLLPAVICAEGNR
mmetsp:Transcript_51876/g.123446  ORF Transcript_51876/g.123446 Transcript_51876/m.123446 type:complete len:101 (-) Transcript_51876:4868-5170(-)